VKAVLITAPLTEPISTADAKTHLRVTGEDSYIEGLVKAARQQVELYLSRALINQTWDIYFTNLSNVLRLPYSPVSSVTSVKYRDLDGVLQVLDSNLYYVVTSTDPAEIVRKYSVTYPETEYGRPDPVVVRQVCGYGATGASVPSPIIHGMKLLITDMYEHRGSYVVGSSASVASSIPGYLTSLLHPYRLYDME
jgi:uncharacterized phiE125 gp8 family phage protein